MGGILLEKNFNELSTVKFQEKMRPVAIEIYESIWPGCKIKDLREQGVKVHILDKEFGIDTISTFKSGQWISIQEKYRRFELWNKYKDFTQEYMNAVGTINEGPGEWFHLGAQIYFVGWADKKETSFPYWFIMDIAKYKIIVEQAGGLDKVGRINYNNKNGRASFYGIPINIIKPAFLLTYHDMQENRDSHAI